VAIYTNGAVNIMRKDYKKLMWDDLTMLFRRPRKLKEIAEACGVCPRTMRRYINRLGDDTLKKVGHYFMPAVARLILQRLGFIG
jgi:hypothetical protein